MVKTNQETRIMVWFGRRGQLFFRLTSLLLLVFGTVLFANHFATFADAHGLPPAPTGAIGRKFWTTEQNAPSFPTPYGVSAYLGTSDSSNSVSLPFVRFDTYHDTEIHLADSTSQMITATITLLNSDGSVYTTTNQSLSAWASDDLDLGQMYGGSFNGAVAITSTNEIAVSADVINDTNSNDNLASYAGVTTAETSVVVPKMDAYYNGFQSNAYIENISPNAADLQITYAGQGIGVVTDTLTVPPRGRGDLSMASLVAPNQAVQGTLSIQSSQSFAVVATTYSPGGYEVLPAFDLGAGSANQERLPWFDSSNGNSSGVYYYNAATAPANVSLTLDDSSGSVLSTVSEIIPSGSTWSVSPVSPYVGNSINGSAIFTSDQLSGFALTVNQLASGGYAIYGQPSVNSSTQQTDLPGIRKNVVGESTGFAVMNNQSVTENYKITYWQNDGILAKTDSLVLGPNASWFYSQACDQTLPDGFVGSVTLENVGSGPPPLAVVNLYALYPVPSTTGATNCGPSPSPTPAPSPSVSPTPIPSPSPIPSATLTGSNAGFGDSKVYLPIVVQDGGSGW